MTPHAPLESFATNGYALLRGVLGADTLDPLRALISREVETLAADLLARGLITDVARDAPFERRLAALYAGRAPEIRKWSAFLFSPEIYRLAIHPAILAGLTAILGPEVTFHGDFQLVPKLPGSEAQAFPWHQDTQYYGTDSRHALVITVWVPLVDVDEHNGCLWVIPGSHLWGLLDAVRGAHHNFEPLEDVEHRGAPVPMRMQTGDALLLTNLTFHASKVNLTDGVRWSIDLGYSKTPQAHALTPDEASSYDYLYRTLDEIGRSRLVVASADPSRVESWQTWADRRRQGRPQAGP